MPLLDHFLEPVKGELSWDTLHSSWASEIARALNRRWLTPPFRALEHTHIGPLAEIDVGTFAHHGPAAPLPLRLARDLFVPIEFGQPIRNHAVLIGSKHLPRGL
jgi:hypothetical protein